MKGRSSLLSLGGVRWGAAARRTTPFINNPRSCPSSSQRFSTSPTQKQDLFEALEGAEKEKKKGTKVIFSGIQPTGVPHLGNYFGALQQWKRLQDEAYYSSSSVVGNNENFNENDQGYKDTRLLFCIVDLHAITMPREWGLLAQWKREMMASLLAIGLDPNLSTMFYQSTVSAHTELQWILSCTASTGYLSRMTQWKSKISVKDDASLLDKEVLSTLKHGLFSYPILQAADILVHRATHVPVGEDQKQHLEFARNCVTNFNHRYLGPYLVKPETIVSSIKRVMSLTNPTSKMSKSDPAAASRILITDTAEAIEKKIKGAVTDFNAKYVWYDPEARPGVSNLLLLLSHLDPHNRTPEQLVADDFGGGDGPTGTTNQVKILKEQVAKAVNAELEPIREKFNEIMSRDKEHPGYLNQVIMTGRSRARSSAANTMRIVRQACELDLYT
ncbi:tryptophanyl-tRNA synthetase [Apodospora peruviana]|uniref:Tryptophan--tRNA ligase, mitochondrial n=1 Tax=Apodospora peruviana TaxID=516989 RepID=A0AAE0LZH1_9PEZI|nr:tryptophanyl-tRNA synthetase [Apodospora peruviana]